MEVTEQPEPGNFAKMDVTYMKATISEMYARRMYFDGLNTLTSLATKNKNSFLQIFYSVMIMYFTFPPYTCTCQ